MRPIWGSAEWPRCPLGAESPCSPSKYPTPVSSRDRAVGLTGVNSLDGIHRLLAYAAAAITVAGIGWSVVLVATGRAGGPAFVRFQAAVVSLLVVGSASGLVLLATGARPAEGLHLLYAIVAIALIPLARSFLGRANGRGPAALMLAAFVVLGGVAYRLFSTG